MRKYRRFISLIVVFVSLLSGGGVKPTVSQSGSHLTLLNQLGGACDAVALQGAYAYVGIGPRVVALNIADPGHPTFVGQTALLPDIVNDIALDGNYAYVANGGAGMQVVDISQPENMQVVATYNTSDDAPDPALAITLMGDRAYIADGRAGLRVVDISDPENPVDPPSGELQTYKEAENSIHSVSGIVVQGDYIYLAYGGVGVLILDMTQPADPFVAAVLDSARDLAMMDNYLYVTSQQAGLHILEMVTSTDLQEVAQSPYKPATLSKAHSVLVAGTYAYITDNVDGGGLQVVDITDPRNPADAGYLGTPGRGKNLTIAGNHAYVASGAAGLRVIDATDVSLQLLVEVGAYTVVGHPVSVAGTQSRAYLASGPHGMITVDMADPLTPTVTSSYTTTAAAIQVATAEGYTYLAGAEGTVAVLDTASAMTPTLMGTYDAGGALTDLVIVEDYVYLTTAAGLQVVDVSNPAQPEQRGSYPTTYPAASVATSRHYVYVAENNPIGQGTIYLRVLDIADPAAPTLVGDYTAQGKARDIAASGSYVYLVGSKMLRVDVADPATPAAAGEYDVVGEAYSVALALGRVYLGISEALVELDSSDPVNFSVIAAYPLPAAAEAGVSADDISVDISLTADKVFVADGRGGLYIFRYRADVYHVYLPLIVRTP